MKLFKNAVLFVVAAVLTINATAQAKKDIVDVAAASQAHTSLVAAIKAADLVTT